MIVIRIEEVRKSLSNIATWLTFDENTRFLKDDRNVITSEHGRALSQEHDICTLKSRRLFNDFSESLEETDVLRKRLRNTVEREKEMKKNIEKKAT